MGPAICVVAVCALLGWCALVESVKAVLVARAACPCRKLTSLTVDAPSVLMTRFSTDGAAAVEKAFRNVKLSPGEGH
ncbi:hypothetical protein ASG63_08895 [Methylobacterium sp. Leaf94]|nr:hypothetical protein ASG63_08895 [Methylobacterium sp. Leaf94]